MNILVSKFFTYMNILLWVLQVFLAFWNIAGGLYMTNNYQVLATEWAARTIPTVTWFILGALQVMFAAGLVLPGITRLNRKLIPISAACLAVISLLGSALYVTFSGFPGILWGIVPAIMAIFVAYGRKT